MSKKTTEKKTTEKKAEKKLLAMDMSIDEGQKLVDSGDVTVAQFTEWVLAKAKLQEKNGATGKGKGGKGRSGCEVTRADFMKHAKAIDIVIDGVKHVANVKHFKASEGDFGSFGWFVSGKGQVKLANGEEVTVQLSINLPVVNSKFQKD